MNFDITKVTSEYNTLTSKSRNIELEASPKNRGPLWIRVSENVKQKEELTDT